VLVHALRVDAVFGWAAGGEDFVTVGFGGDTDFLGGGKALSIAVGDCLGCDRAAGATLLAWNMYVRVR